MNLIREFCVCYSRASWPATVKKLERYYLILLLFTAGTLNLSAGPWNEASTCSPEQPATHIAQATPFLDPGSYFTLTPLTPPHEEILMEETEEVRSSYKKFFDGGPLDIRLLYALTPVRCLHPTAFLVPHALIPPQQSLHILYGVLRV